MNQKEIDYIIKTISKRHLPTETYIPFLTPNTKIGKSITKEGKFESVKVQYIDQIPSLEVSPQEIYTLILPLTVTSSYNLPPYISGYPKFTNMQVKVYGNLVHGFNNVIIVKSIKWLNSHEAREPVSE